MDKDSWSSIIKVLKSTCDEAAFAREMIENVSCQAVI
jgi:hypothetical protein